MPQDAFLQVRERRRARTLTLQWATYYDAADQAGQSRVWGGIHILADDFAGRIMGCDDRATTRTEKALTYFDGTGAAVARTFHR